MLMIAIAMIQSCFFIFAPSLSVLRFAVSRDCAGAAVECRIVKGVVPFDAATARDLR
jgi:hypothetical protein